MRAITKNNGSTSILAVIDSLEVGGAQRHLLAVAAGAREAGYSLVVATSGDEPLADAFHALDIPVVSLRHRSIKHRLSPSFMLRLAVLARRKRAALIHAHLHSASVAAALVHRITGIPLVLTHHSMNTWQSTLHRSIGRWADEQADAVIAVADNIGASIQGNGVGARVIPNGVRAPSHVRTAREIRERRAAFGLGADDYVVSFVGRMTADKNPIRFVEVAGRTAARVPDVRFIMLGDGPLRPSVEESAVANGLDGRLVLAGFQPDAVDLHPIADVLALTSDSEGSPLAVLEAMAAGRPVVATRVGDVPRQVIHGETGFVVARDDLDGFVDALVALRDPEVRRRLGAAGRARVKQHFSQQRMIARTLETYGEVLARQDERMWRRLRTASRAAAAGPDVEALRLSAWESG